MKETLFKAGPVTARWEPETTFLRHIKAGPHELLRGIYLALRDENWDTLLPELENYREDIGESDSSIRCDLIWKRGAIDFRGTLSLEGRRDGTMRYHFRGESFSTFKRNRIGFLLLHGPSVAGKEVVIETVDGTVKQHAFPRTISPHQPFFNIRAMTHEAVSGLKVQVRMEGDTFETEDQRNWTDASFKTYCTPLGLPFPVEVNPGDVVEQTITVTLDGTVPEGLCGQTTSEPLELKTDYQSLPCRLPGIGLEIPTRMGVPSLQGGALERMIKMRPDHLRVSVLTGDPLAPEILSRASEEALAVGCALEVALFTREGDELVYFFKELKKRLQAPVLRWLVFDADAKATPPEATAAVKDALAAVELSGVVGAGTDHFFTELNREREAVEGADFICFSLNPQVHAFDDLSLMETLEIQGACVESARTFAGERPIVVSPVTFKMRSNPNATQPVVGDPPSRVLSRADPRQQLPFGAVWTLGSLFYLAQACVESVTLFETHGPLGVMDETRGEPYPVYDALVLFNSFKGGRLRPLQTTDSLKVIGFDLESADGDEACRIIANLTNSNLTVRCGEQSLELDPYTYNAQKL